MKTRNKIVALATAAGLVLSLTAVSSPAADTNAARRAQGGPGQIELSKTLIGRDIHTAQNENVGKLQDVVLDLESGRVLYGVVAVTGGSRVGVPSQLFTQTGGNKALMINTDKQKLTGAPQFTSQFESNLSNVDFANNVYHYFGQPAWWEQAGQATGKTFNNVHKASDLATVTVKDPSGQDIGKVNNVMLDLRHARVPFVILAPSASFGAGQGLYPIPPMAFTAGSDAKTLVSGLDRQKLQGAPKLDKNNLGQLSDPAFAASVYQYYGKEPYWHLSPTGR